MMRKITQRIKYIQELFQGQQKIIDGITQKYRRMILYYIKVLINKKQGINSLLENQ
ncbi:unnamed protein product [Paramecium octaurelia]|uniref:Uncharacterized protein n=1 Tax=Paramecium octaurelia TaxID=43137 RepID=A0A8S1U0V9_PAROT|nr:unnamed protein product [Paramecium octaurelia]